MKDQIIEGIISIALALVVLLILQRILG